MGSGSKIAVKVTEGPWAKAAVCSALGRRTTNEDAYVLRCSGLEDSSDIARPHRAKLASPVAEAPAGGGLFDDLPDTVAGPSLPSVEKAAEDVDCLVAVLDGHGGDWAARLCAERLPKELSEQLEAAGRESPDSRRAAVEGTFLALDRHLRIKLGPKACDLCGSTCVFALVRLAEDEPGKLHVLLANLGDSRALLLTSDCSDASPGTLRLVAQTEDHKPEVLAESRRIVAAGGEVGTHSEDKLQKPRVDRQLACSRALGDFSYKEDAALLPEDQKVSIKPDVLEFVCSMGDAVVLACDGVFDVMSSAAVGAMVAQELQKSDDPAKAAAAVVQAALKDPRQEDNCTCIVLRT
eukprot:TRINITY_DN1572_c0_g5_i3.p1 TRINITY_DN1572_c0_g5~~TRINITY_DN1572_c0_g5_i3.p1  ORF type:complete len:351 (-),score=62.28 TRINITY_DN1572_c0_g5_i3:60-1112(-)